MAVCRAYNTWLAEVCSKAPDRLRTVGVVSLQDAEGAAKELFRLPDLGARAVMINGTAGAKRLDHPDHDVFFAAADQLKMPIAVHFSLQFPVVDKLFEHHFPNRVLAGIMPIMAGLTSVLCSGLLDRYPNLKFAFLEGGISWVPAHVEEAFLSRVVEEVGEDLFMFSSDYPHADRTEGTAQFLQRREDVPATVRKKLLEDNARRFYGL
jgi:predicted TIM-barrel fold metal-dependent hydrolase